MGEVRGLLPGEEIIASSDPLAAVNQSLEAVKAWYAESVGSVPIERLVAGWREVRQMREVVASAGVGRSIWLVAMEADRRAERAVGRGIQIGQDRGEIAKGRAFHNDGRVSPASFGIKWSALANTIYPSARGTDAEFEDAIIQLRREQIMTRAHLVRKILGKEPERNQPTGRWARLEELANAGYTSTQIAKELGVAPGTVTDRAKEAGIEIPADRVVKSGRKRSPARLVEEFLATLDSLVPSCEMIDPSGMATPTLEDADAVIENARKELGALHRRIQKELSQ